MLLDAAAYLLDLVHVGDELGRPGCDGRRVSVGEREQFKGLAHRAVPGRPPGALRPLPGPPIGFRRRGCVCPGCNLELIQERRLSGGAQGLRPRGYLAGSSALFLEVPGEGEPGLEDGLSQLFELLFLRVPQREADAPSSQGGGETRFQRRRGCDRT